MFLKFYYFRWSGSSKRSSSVCSHQCRCSTTTVSNCSCTPSSSTGICTSRYTHLFIHSFIYPFNSFIHSFLYLFIDSFIYSKIHLFIHRFIYLFLDSFIYSFNLISRIHSFHGLFQGLFIYIYLLWRIKNRSRTGLRRIVKRAEIYWIGYL